MKHNAEVTTMDEAEGREIVTIAQGLDDWYALLGRQFGPLSRPQRRMLRLLDLAQGVRVGDLGKDLELTTAGTTRMLDKLEALGYALRVRNQISDQRQVYVTLTSAGKQALQDADAIFFARVQSALHVLDEAERATLANLLHKMNSYASAQTPLSEHKKEQD
jgi:DNA-binding MarR family transcriptional regulator